MASTTLRHSTPVWRQALVLVLALGIGMQGVPLQSLVQTGTSTACVCAEQGYCPRNPDGACACPHHGHKGHESTGGPFSPDPSAEASAQTATPQGDRLVLRSCDTTGPEARAGGATVKWLLPRVERLSSPPVVKMDRPATAKAWGPQRVGDDIFHPPDSRSA